MIQVVLRGRDGENLFGLQHPLFGHRAKWRSSGKIAAIGQNSGHWIKWRPAKKVDGLLKL